MKIERFEDIIAWQKAKVLVIEIFKQLYSCKDYKFKGQIMDAAVSIMNNIAEGYERRTNNEFRHFLFVSKGSCGEVRSMLYLAFSFSYMTKENFIFDYKLSIEISKCLSGLIKTL